MKGADGNKEFLAYFNRTAMKDAENPPQPADIAQLFRSVENNEQKGESNEQQKDESNQQKDE